MKITILVDNNTLTNLRGEWGLSMHISEGETQILFDLGSSDLFIDNASHFGINLKEVDFVILSHGHWDHTGGLEPLLKWYTTKVTKEERPKLITHPLTFTPKISPKGADLGTISSVETINRHLETQLSKEPVWLTDQFVYLGEIPRVNNFENQHSMGKTLQNGELIDDYLVEDTALVYKNLNGLVIITGCSHSGICNIVEYAKQVCCEERIIDIIGGFHLLSPSPEQLQETLEYMQKLHLEALHAGHCTDLASKIALAQVANLQELGIGLQLEFA